MNSSTKKIPELNMCTSKSLEQKFTILRQAIGAQVTSTKILASFLTCGTLTLTHLGQQQTMEQ